MSYLSIQPFEVRLEILMNARAAVQFLGIPDRGKGSVPLESLNPILSGISQLITEQNPVVIDDVPIEAPMMSRADFVILSASGVLLREKPVAESLDEGIIGISPIYETADIARKITIDWQLFSPAVREIEVNTVDNFATTTVLTPNNNRWVWESTMPTYQIPAIKDVRVIPLELPYLSYVLLFGTALFVILYYQKYRKSPKKSVLVGMLSLAFICYPFIRFSLDISGISQRKPTEERTERILTALLTNVYRSFEARNEEQVYDRLARSVLGDQLTQIY